MKVVLFCGGLGTRLREYSETVPKPMVNIGYRPILWHLMKYYAHYGHADFILCLGYRGDAIKQYFLHYDECLTNDFTLSAGGDTLQLHSRDIQNWRITFVDTGMHASVGQRLKAVEKHLTSEEVFLANYADGLSDLSLPRYLDHFRSQDALASFICVRPHHSFHVVSMGRDSLVTDIRNAAQSGLLINGGFFAFRREIFDYIRDGEDLVEEPFQRLVSANRLIAYKHDGFWVSMDTFKDKQLLDELEAHGTTPWKVWTRLPGSSLPGSSSLPVTRSADGPKTPPFPAEARARATTIRPPRTPISATSADG